MSLVNPKDMSYEKAKALLNKYKTGNCTAHEKALVEKWLFNFQNDKIDLSEQTMDVVKNEIWSKLPLNIPKQRKLIRWPHIATVAAVLIVLGIGLWFYTNEQIFRQAQGDITYANDVVPGSNKAYLTLTNGKRVALSDANNGEIAEQSGIRITKTSDGQLVYEIADKTNKTNNSAQGFNTIETPRGGQYQVNLPDGSKVWLNAASTLKFPITFAHLKERKVELNGEAYFEVKHDAKQPFRVQTAGQIVEDIGTAFNINSYADELTTKTTLLEGSVKVSSLHSSISKLLIPGQQATLQSDRFSVEEVNVENTIAWKNGFFMFNDEPLGEVMRKISRWYGVEIVFKDLGLEKQSAYGEISKYDKVSEVLKMLEMTGEMHFEITGNRITVTKK